MESIFPFIGVALLVLICPLAMLAIGGVGIVIARARGQKSSLMDCMGGHGGHHQAATATETVKLTGEVARLQTELEALKAQRHDAPVVINIAADGAIPTVSGFHLEQGLTGRLAGRCPPPLGG